MPTSLKGYGGFVEDKIQRAHERGFFKNNKLRGKPIEYDQSARNPFVDTVRLASLRVSRLN